MSDYTLPTEIEEAVWDKDYATVIRQSQGLDSEEVEWRSHALVAVLRSNSETAGDVGLWREHYKALQDAIHELSSEYDTEPFQVSLISYLRHLKGLSATHTLSWAVDRVIDYIREDAYDMVTAICNGVGKSRYLRLKSTSFLWVVIEKLLQGKIAFESDDVQLMYVYTLLYSISDFDSKLAHSTLEEAQKANEKSAQKDTDGIGLFELRWPGFSMLDLPKRVDDDKEYEARKKEVEALTDEATKEINTIFLAEVFGISEIEKHIS